MVHIIIAIVLVLIIIYIVPFAIYASLSPGLGLKIPKSKSPARFLLSILLSKLGTAILFVVLFYFAKDFFSAQWLLYAGAWWIMFLFQEISQPIEGHYSWKEALVGIVSETIYLPLSAYLLTSIFK